MNSTAAQQQTAQTAENILSEQKSFLSVQFAITGVPEADMMSGLYALFGLEYFKHYSTRHRLRLFEYLVSLYADGVRAEENAADQWKSLQAYNSGSLGAGINQLFGCVNPSQNSPPVYAPNSAFEEMEKAIAIQQQKDISRMLEEMSKQDNGPDEIWKIKP